MVALAMTFFLIRPYYFKIQKIKNLLLKKEGNKVQVIAKSLVDGSLWAVGYKVAEKTLCKRCGTDLKEYQIGQIESEIDSRFLFESLQPSRRFLTLSGEKRRLTWLEVTPFRETDLISWTNKRTPFLSAAEKVEALTRVVLSLAKGIKAIHKKEMVHRSVSLENIAVNLSSKGVIEGVWLKKTETCIGYDHFAKGEDPFERSDLFQNKREDVSWKTYDWNCLGQVITAVTKKFFSEDIPVDAKKFVDIGKNLSQVCYSELVENFFNQLAVEDKTVQQDIPVNGYTWSELPAFTSEAMKKIVFPRQKENEQEKVCVLQ